MMLFDARKIGEAVVEAGSGEEKIACSKTLPDLNESAELAINGTETQARPFHLEIQTVFKMKTLSLPLLIDLRAFCYPLAAGLREVADCRP